MDPDARNESVPDGLLDAVAEANHETFTKNGTPGRSETDPARQGTDAKTKTATKQTTKTDSDEGDADNEEGLDIQDFSRQPVPSQQTDDSDATSQSTDSGANTNTETNTEAEIDWTTTLPPAPAEIELTPPKPDENGQIDPLEYTNYVKELAKHEMRLESYNTMVTTKAFDEVERILPEVKTNPGLATIIRNSFLANNDPVEMVNVAKELKGLFSGKQAEAAATATKNAKTSIEIQKNSTVETKGATQKKTDTTSTSNLDKRLARNDTSAFEELMNDWQAKKLV